MNPYKKRGRPQGSKNLTSGPNKDSFNAFLDEFQIGDYVIFDVTNDKDPQAFVRRATNHSRKPASMAHKKFSAETFNAGSCQKMGKFAILVKVTRVA